MKTNKGLIFFAASCLLFTLLLLILVEPNSCREHSRPTIVGRPDDDDGHESTRTSANVDAGRTRRHRHHYQRAPIRNTRAPNVRVRTKLGVIAGVSIDVNDKRVHAFYGVRFGESPTKERRFKPPVPVKPWSDVYNATKPANCCFQASDGEYGTFRGADMWNPKTPKSEDCLFMNIWAPAKAENATVMVWLFGGGFWYGGGSLDIYNGVGLAAEGNVIVVNPNYRLGAFGFLFLDDAEVPGNVGLLDQQLALKWVQENIAAFGGDPNKVSLFGESAGAASIVAHMIAPESWPLFNNGILQSGSLDNPWSMETPTRAANRSWAVVKEADCVRSRIADTAQCLRNLTAEKLDAAMWAAAGAGPQKYLEFPLVIVSRDRAGFFRHDAYEALRHGKYRPRTDLMFGINQDEGTFWMAYYGLRKYFDPKNNTQGGGDEKLINHTRFDECVSEVIFKDQPQAYKSAALWEYRDKEPCKSGRDPAFYRNQLNQLIGDYFFTCDSVWLADDVVKRKMGRVYVYHFEQRIGSNPWPAWMGVMHAYEIEYIFGLPLVNQKILQNYVNLLSDSNNNGNNKVNFYNYTREDRSFAREVIQYWTSFATAGIPTSKHQKDEWPAYKLKDKAWYVLRAQNAGQSVLYNQKESECKVWRSVRDIEYQLYEAKILSGAKIMSFQLRALLTITTIGLVLSNVITCV